MSAPCSNLCSPWADAEDICNPPDASPETIEAQLLNASNILFHFTGRLWPGSCAETVRPCGGGSKDWCGCSGGRTCGCRRLSEIQLGGSPVTSITEVKIDGEVLDPSLYRVDDWAYLVYLPAEDDDRQGWPCCQRVERADTEDDSFSVSYTYGTGPDIGGKLAAATLAGDLAKACVGDTTCQLPKRVTTVVRQGVTLAVIDPLSLFEDGKTGIPDVDLWLASVRVGRRRRRATVMVPGQERRIRRVGT